MVDAPDAPDVRDVREPEPSKGERTRHAVLEAAIRQFAAVGFRSTSVAGVAREVGVTPSAVFAYFSTKQALFEAAVDADVAALIAQALPELMDGRFDGDFALVFRRLLGALDDHPLAKRILQGHERAGVEHLVELPAEAHLHKGIARALREGQLTGAVRLDIDPEQMAIGLEAVVIALVTTILQTGGAPDPDYARGVLAVLDASLRPSG